MAAGTLALGGLVLVAGPSSAGLSGATYTTDVSCNGVNVNLFASKDDVYLNGGPKSPTSAGLTAGKYYVKVTAPDGTMLGQSATAVVTVDADGRFAQCYHLDEIVYSTSSGYTTLGFDDTTNGGGVYKVWIGVDTTFKEKKTDNFKVGGTTPLVDLTASKTANPSLTRTYTWGIQKSVDHPEIDQSSTDATFNYEVKVTKSAGTDSAWAVKGVITVSNTNAVAVSGTVTEVGVNNGGTCVVDNPTDPSLPNEADVTVPAGTIAVPGTVDVPYTCTWGSAPSASAGTNTATITTLGSTNPPAPATASFDFANATVTSVDDSVSVSDTYAGDLGTTSSSQTYSYGRPVTGTAGTCTSYDNTATFTTNTTGTTGSAGQTAKLCVGADLQVSKDASPSYTRTYNWSISKGVDKTLVEQIGGSATFNYTVKAAETGFTDSAWQATGTITVKNPNDWESISGVNVTDAVNDAGASCIVTDGSNVTFAAGETKTFAYTCTWASLPASSSLTNTATAAWDATAAYTPHGSATGTASVDFTTPTTTVNKTVTVTDTFNGGTPGTLGMVTATDSAPFAAATYNYGRTIPVPTWNCTSYPNTASITETGQTAGQTVKVCGPAKTGALTIGFWQNKNGQGIISGGASVSSVCKSGAWLRQYAPFQDLSATASCSQVATYVYNTIKAANASGSSMNAMLKAQMLATALDVYFSDPALGGNKINAPGGPIGSFTIDLTKVCAMIDGSGGSASCNGSYQNVSAAFGGATSLSVSQMLAYAAAQSNVGGSSWYSNVKSTQELAKNAFDAINNQVAFAI